MPPYTLRRATGRDLGTLVRQRRAMFEEMHVRRTGKGFSTAEAAAADAHDRAYRRWARARLKSGKLLAWVASDGDEPVAGGCLWLQEVQPRPGMLLPAQPYLLSMWTDASHRGRGLASRIVDAALAWCRANGYPRMTLHASEAGRPVYERMGFERTWEMRKDLPARRRGARPQPRGGAR